MPSHPFTITSDLDLGAKISGALVARDADVSITEGDVPESIEATHSGAAFQLRAGEFLLLVPDGSRILVREGREIIYSKGPDAADQDIVLFVMGSAWGALCYQRDLIPIHASANLVDGKIVAFTGHSGAGKSTLAANLANHGCPFFTDDTLIFDPSAQGDGAMCFSGQKQLKLWRDAIDATGTDALAPVRVNKPIDKHYAQPPQASEITFAPLKTLFLLKRARGDATKANDIVRLHGGPALQAFRRNLYRPQYAEGLVGRKRLFTALKHLLEQVELFEYTRLTEPSNYEPGVEFVMKAIGSNG